MKFKWAMTVAAALALATSVASAGRIGPAETSALRAGEGVTAEQRATLNAKLALITSMMRAAGADRVGPQVSAEKQRWLFERLFNLPLADLQAIGMPGGADALGMAIDRVKAKSAGARRAEGKALGDSGTDLVFIPITPCRFIDTRVTGGQIPNNGVRGYDLDETGDTYGGSAACDPKSFVGGNANNMAAIFLNVASVGSPFAPGFLGARPFGSANVTSLVNWYEAQAQVANAAIIPINQATVTNEIEFFGTQTHIVADVMGVFAAPAATPLSCATGTTTFTSVLDTSNRAFNLTATGCPTGYTMVSNSCSGTGDIGMVQLAATGVYAAGSARCQGRYEGSTSATVTNTPWCCRIPGR